MKLRNKLAAVLATAMVVTSVPVVTMAYSTNSITRETLLQAEKEAFRDEATAPAIRIELKSGDLTTISATNKEVFYVTLENADWLGSGDTIETSEGDVVDAKVPGKAGQDTLPAADGTALEGTSSDIKITRESDSRIKVELTGATRPACFGTKNDELYIPLMIRLNEGEAKVKLETMGSGSRISEGSWVIANTSDKVATVKAGSPKAFHKEGKIAEITITEAYKNSMKMDSSKGNNFALVELDDTDFKFDMTRDNVVGSDNAKYYAVKKNGDVRSFSTTNTSNDDKTYTHYNLKAEYAYGFGGCGLSTVDVYVDNDDASTMYVKLPNNVNADSQGVIKLKELYVKSSVKNPTEGELKVDVSGDVEEANDLVVAKIGDYTATITVKDDKVIDVIGGHDEEIEYTFAEVVDDTLTDAREIDFTLENGYFGEVVFDKNKNADEDATLKAVQSGKIVIIKSLEQKSNKDTNKKYAVADIQKAITDVEIKDDKIVGFTLKPQAVYKKDKLDSFVFKSDIRAGLTQSGDIKLTAKSRDLEEAVSGVIGKAITPVKVETEAAVLKTGLKDQLAGKITVTETDKNIFKKGEKLVVFFEDASGVTISTNSSEKPEVKVTSGDAQIGDVKVTTDTNKDGKTVTAITVEIKRASKEASAIEISNIHFDVDRTTAEGAYDIQIGGKALTEFTVDYLVNGSTTSTYKAPADAIVVEDFMVNGTPNTQDITATNGLAKGTITFEIGKTTYTALDGTEKTMDAAAFIQDPGYTMIPLRYVAEAFGVDSKDILFSNGTVTILAGTRTIQLTNGSKVAFVNGAKYDMGAALVIRDNRAYAPVGEIATILGLSKEWDATTKVAKFTNA